MNFLGHTEELVSRLRVIFIAVIACSALVAFLPADIHSLLSFGLYSPLILEFARTVQHDLLPEGVSLIAGGFMDAVLAYLMLSLLMGVLLSSPIIAYEVYKFVNPALFPSERRSLAWFVLSFVALFSLGVLFAYFLYIPLTFKVMMYFVKSFGALPLIPLNDFITNVVAFMISTGLIFTFPVFVVLAVKFGMLTPNTLAANRRYVYLGLAVFLAFITPDPTPLSMLITIIPLIILFEVSIIAGRVTLKRSRKTQAHSQS